MRNGLLGMMGLLFLLKMEQMVCILLSADMRLWIMRIAGLVWLCVMLMVGLM